MTAKLILAALLFVTGCAAGATEQAFIKIPNAEFPFTEIVKAARSADMSIISTDSEAGIITAEAPYNPLLTWNSSVVNLYVTRNETHTKIEAFSNVKGQVITYGTNRAAIDGICAQLALEEPETVCDVVE